MSSTAGQVRRRWLSERSPTSPQCVTNDIYTKEDAEILTREAPSQSWTWHERSDLLVINRIGLALLVGASLGVMASDARRMRKERLFVFTNLKTRDGLTLVIEFLERIGGLDTE